MLFYASGLWETVFRSFCVDKHIFEIDNKVDLTCARTEGAVCGALEVLKKCAILVTPMERLHCSVLISYLHYWVHVEVFV